jgi:hypothetical protein
MVGESEDKAKTEAITRFASRPRTKCYHCNSTMFDPETSACARCGLVQYCTCSCCPFGGKKAQRTCKGTEQLFGLCGFERLT